MRRATAQAVVRAIQAPVPTSSGGTLYVSGVPADKWDDTEFIRRMVATYCTRVALEKGCTRVTVLHPTRDPITFDVIDRIQRVARGVGHYPHPHLGATPRNLATMGFRALGADLTPRRALVPVSAVLTSSPVSGHPGG